MTSIQNGGELFFTRGADWFPCKLKEEKTLLGYLSFGSLEKKKYVYFRVRVGGPPLFVMENNQVDWKSAAIQQRKKEESLELLSV